MSLHVLCVGGEDHVLRLPFITALQNRGFRVTAAGTGDSTPFEQAGVQYHRYRFGRFLTPLQDLHGIADLKRIVRHVGPDIVQSFDTKPNLLAPLASDRSRVVVRTINGMGWVFSSSSPAALALRPVYRALQSAVSAKASATVFQNTDDMRYFESYHLLGNGAGRTISGSGVDVEAFDRSVAAGPSREEMRRSLGLGEAPLVIMVSRLTRQKGVATLLKAAGLIHAQRPNVRFLLVGPRESEGPLAISSEEIAQHAPYVIALGKRQDIPSLLGAADVFAFPTEYREGVPRVLLEAGLATLPAVTTRMPGCTDVVEDGWNGSLVAPKDSQSLASSILKFLGDPEMARLAGRRSRAKVLKGFGLETVVDAYSRLYRELIAKRRSDVAERAAWGQSFP